MFYDSFFWAVPSSAWARPFRELLISLLNFQIFSDFGPVEGFWRNSTFGVSDDASWRRSKLTNHSPVLSQPTLRHDSSYFLWSSHGLSLYIPAFFVKISVSFREKFSSLFSIYAYTVGPHFSQTPNSAIFLARKSPWEMRKFKIQKNRLFYRFLFLVSRNCH